MLLQVISPGGSVGRVKFEHDLYRIQDDVYDEPTVLVIDRVTGEEEIPEGTVAVLTPDAPDVLSHVSVRARNMRVLFATCHDGEPMYLCALTSSPSVQWVCSIHLSAGSRLIPLLPSSRRRPVARAPQTGGKHHQRQDLGCWGSHLGES